MMIRMVIRQDSIRTFKTGQIDTNGIKRISNFNGEILKVVVFTNNIIHNVRFNLKSVDGEEICSDNLFDKYTRFYPKNTVKISQEQTYIENYYIAGDLLMDISGIGDGEVINNVAIYYR